MKQKNKYGFLLNKIELPTVIINKDGSILAFNNLLNELFRTSFHEGDDFFEAIKKKV